MARGVGASPGPATSCPVEQVAVLCQDGGGCNLQWWVPRPSTRLRNSADVVPRAASEVDRHEDEKQKPTEPIVRSE